MPLTVLSKDGIVLKKKDTVLSKGFGDRLLLFSKETHLPFVLNATGRLVYESIDGEKVLSDLVSEIKNQYGGFSQDKEEEIVIFFEELVKRSLVDTNI